MLFNFVGYGVIVVWYEVRSLGVVGGIGIK